MLPPLRPAQTTIPFEVVPKAPTNHKSTSDLPRGLKNKRLPRKQCRRPDKDMQGLAYLETHQRLPIDEDDLDLDYDAYSWREVLDGIRAAELEYTQADQEEPGATATPLDVIHTQEQIRQDTAEVQRVASVSSYNHKRAKRNNAHLDQEHEEHHLRGIHCRVQWAPVVILKSLVTDFSTHWAHFGYHVAHANTPSPQTLARAQHAISQLPVQVATSDLVELTLHTTQEPLCQLLGEKVFDECDKYIETKMDFRRLHSMLDRDYVKSVVRTGTTRVKPARDTAKRDEPTQMAFISKCPTDWTLSSKAKDGNPLIDHVHFAESGCHPYGDVMPGTHTEQGPLQVRLRAQALVALHKTDGRLITDMPWSWYLGAQQVARNAGLGLREFHSACLQSLNTHQLHFEQQQRRSMTFSMPALLHQTMCNTLTLENVYGSSFFTMHATEGPIKHHSNMPTDKAFGMFKHMWSTAWVLVFAPNDSTETAKALRWAAASVEQAHANGNNSLVIVATKQSKGAEAAAQSLSHDYKLCDYDTEGSNTYDATAVCRCKASIWAVLSPLHHTRAACKINILRNALLTPALQGALRQDPAHSCTIQLSTEVIATQSEDMHLAGRRRAPRALQKLLHSSAAHGHVCEPSPHARAYAPCKADVEETSTNHIHPAATPLETLIQRAMQATHDFAYEGAHECYFTDGSAKDIENQDGVSFATGAAYVRCIADRADQSLAKDQMQYEATMMLPSAQGVFHENYKAELIAILGSLESAQCTNVKIFTDSKATINSIKSQLYHRTNTANKLHGNLTSAIASSIHRRAVEGLHTRIERSRHTST